MISIRVERSQDGPPIETLLDLAFGAARQARPSYRLRDGISPLRFLCFVAEAEHRVVGTIRYWPVRVGPTRPALLLGPIAVNPAHQRHGIGRCLIEISLEEARAAGHAAVCAVGTAAYLGRFGFSPAADQGISLPSLDEPRRLLALALVPGALDDARGAIARVSPPSAARQP